MSVEIYPVVHIREVDMAAQQAKLAFNNGADGVFLIDHCSDTPRQMLDTFNLVAHQNPNRFVGVNLLTAEAGVEEFDLLHRIFTRHHLERMPSAIWTDDAEARDADLICLREAFPDLNAVQYFGGVAFKYTHLYTEDPEVAAKEAAELEQYVDVMVTTGRETGVPPAPEKVRAMKDVISKPLAISSGISAENITDYAGSFDKLLVASSIEVDPLSGIFDEEKLRELVEIAHSL